MADHPDFDVAVQAVRLGGGQGYQQREWNGNESRPNH
jgi:hypothetical protein